MQSANVVGSNNDPAEFAIGAVVQFGNGQGEGIVRFCGPTEFSTGVWVGVELSTPTGKNNGTVQGVKYFECPENFGVFARPPMLRLKPKTLESENKPQSQPLSSPVRPIEPASVGDARPTKNEEVDDLRLKLKILEKKRAEDREKLKDLERYKTESEQLKLAREKLMERIKDLQGQVKTLRESAAAQEGRDELKETIEILTLDKDMAEERCELLQMELEELRGTVESLNGELDVMRAGQATPQGEVTELIRQNEKLKEALIKLKQISTEEETEKSRRIREIESELLTLRNAKNENQKLKDDVVQYCSTIEELRATIDDSTGMPEMVEKLTDRCLTFEEVSVKRNAQKISELQVVVEDLEALKDLSDELEENHAENERFLKAQIDEKERGIAERDTKLLEFSTLIEEYERSIFTMKDITDKEIHERAKLAQLNREMHEQQEQPRGSMEKINLMNLSQEIQRKGSKIKCLEIELASKQLLIDMVKRFLGEQFFKTEYDSLVFASTLSAVAGKSRLALDYLESFVDYCGGKFVSRMGVNYGLEELNEREIHDTVRFIQSTQKLLYMASKLKAIALKASPDEFGGFTSFRQEISRVDSLLEAVSQEIFSEKFGATASSELAAAVTSMSNIYRLSKGPSDFLDFIDKRARLELSENEAECEEGKIEAMQKISKLCIDFPDLAFTRPADDGPSMTQLSQKLLLESKEIGNRKSDDGPWTKRGEQFRAGESEAFALQSRLSTALQEKTKLLLSLRTLQAKNEELELELEVVKQQLEQLDATAIQLKECESARTRMQSEIRHFEDTVVELQNEVQQLEIQLSMTRSGSLETVREVRDDSGEKYLRSAFRLAQSKLSARTELDCAELLGGPSTGGQTEEAITSMRDQLLQVAYDIELACASTRIVNLSEPKSCKVNCAFFDRQVRLYEEKVHQITSCTWKCAA